MQKKNEIVVENGIEIVIINDRIGSSTKNFEWSDIEKNLKKYVGSIQKIKSTNELVIIAPDFPDEFCHSKDTRRLKGALKRTKAVVSTAIKPLIESASNKRHLDDYGKKHGSKAKYGWNIYDVIFKIPVLDNSGNIIRYNQFKGILLTRISHNKKQFLYDIVKIKKETV